MSDFLTGALIGGIAGCLLVQFVLLGWRLAHEARKEFWR